MIDEADDILEFTKLELLSSLGQNLSSTAQILLLEHQSQKLRKMPKICLITLSY